MKTEASDDPVIAKNVDSDVINTPSDCPKLEGTEPTPRSRSEVLDEKDSSSKSSPTCPISTLVNAKEPGIPSNIDNIVPLTMNSNEKIIIDSPNLGEASSSLKVTSSKAVNETKATQTVGEFSRDNENLDHSLLQPSLNLGVKNVRQILSCIQSGSLEVQDVIFNECSIIYECKVCNNLFRCLANLLSHKRFYCKESFCNIYNENKRQTQTDVTIVIEPESPPELEDEDFEDVAVTNDQENTDPIVLEKIQISTPKIFNPNKEARLFTREEVPEENKDETFIHLEHIKGNNSAVFQTVIETSDKMDDSATQSSEKEEENMEGIGNTGAPKAIVVSREKKLMKRSDCDLKTMTCLKCQNRYETLKGLYIHMMTIHAKKRLYYPCLYCKTSFVQIYGVGRHMMKIHNKTKEQVARIRDLVKRRAFIRKGPFLLESMTGNKEPHTETVLAPKMHTCSKCKREFDRKSSQISHEKFCRFGGAEPTPPTPKKKVISQNGTSVNRCLKCGRTFKQRPSQISHSKYCKFNMASQLHVKEKPPCPVVKRAPKIITLQPFVYEKSTRPKRDAKKKKMSKDFVSSQSLKWRSANKVESVSDSKADSSSVVLVDPKSPKGHVDIKSPKEQADHKSQKSQVEQQLTKTQIEENSPKVHVYQKPIKVEMVMKSPSVVIVKKPPTPIQVKPPPQTKSSPQKVSPQGKSANQMKSPSQSRTTFGMQSKSPPGPKAISLNVIEGRVYSIINAQKLSCLKCHRKFSTFSNLRRHAATHIGWMRFKCKHCIYQSFNRSDCRSHIQRMHSGSATANGNVDKYIIKLPTGKLNVRREDLLSENPTKTPTKTPPLQETKASVSHKETQLINIKSSKPISPVFLKSPPPTPPPPAKSLTPALPVKSSARKSTGGMPSQRHMTNKLLAQTMSTVGQASKKKPISPPCNPVSPPTLRLPSPPPAPTVLRKKSISPQSLGSPPSLSLQTRTKAIENTPATTKPHVILLNSRARPSKPDATPTLVTRAGTYTKTVLTLKPVSPKTNVVIKQEPLSSTEYEESNKRPSSQLLDHQYT